jgi:hypothetical protein
MSTDIYKLKYIKYKKKYSELKALKENISNIEDKIIILPKEYNILEEGIRNKFEVYERDNNTKPISYIKTQYLIEHIGSGETNLDTITSSNKEEDNILEKEVITPDEYFILSDSNKSKYSINESDFEKFPNRVVPKNYKKIN